MRATRYPLAIPALYRVSGHDRWKRGLTTNISDTGVLFDTAEPVPAETLVELTFYLPEQLGNLPAGQLTCVGKVVRQPPVTEDGPARAAARFLEIRSMAVVS